VDKLGRADLATLALVGALVVLYVMAALIVGLMLVSMFLDVVT
jgi:hypothetical protein